MKVVLGILFQTSMQFFEMTKPNQQQPVRASHALRKKTNSTFENICCSSLNNKNQNIYLKDINEFKYIKAYIHITLYYIKELIISITQMI